MLKLWLVLCVVVAVFAEQEQEQEPQFPVYSEKDVKEYREFLEKSKEDDGQTLEDRMAVNPLAKPWENSGRYQGDIVLNDEDIEGMVSSMSTRKAYIRYDTTWPGAVIVFEFAAGHFTNHQRQLVIDAMNDIARNTCVRFRFRQWWENVGFVRITNNPTGCYATVGYQRNGITINNLANGCMRHTIIIHELLHTAGFFHMQSTYNRDRYVSIMWQNIPQNMRHNFDMYPSTMVSNLGVHYEYTSNMHYDRFAFSTNGQPTMLPNFPDHGMMGQMNFVHSSDWRRLNRHYNCPGAWN